MNIERLRILQDADPIFGNPGYGVSQQCDNCGEPGDCNGDCGADCRCGGACECTSCTEPNVTRGR